MSKHMGPAPNLSTRILFLFQTSKISSLTKTVADSTAECRSARIDRDDDSTWLDSYSAAKVLNDDWSETTNKILLLNWKMHETKMAPYRAAVERQSSRGRLPVCRNLSAKTFIMTDKRGRSFEKLVCDYSYADGKLNPDDIAIQTWACYSDGYDREFTWGQFEGARRIMWPFLKLWIQHMKKPAEKRALVFSTCYCFLADVSDKIKKVTHEWPEETVLPPTVQILIPTVEELPVFVEEEAEDSEDEVVPEEQQCVGVDVVEDIHMVTVTESPSAEDVYMAPVTDEQRESDYYVRDENEFEFSRYNRLRSSAIEEMQRCLQSADPHNLTCKCWTCVERFIRRNPLSLHNQYDLTPHEFPEILYVDPVERARDAHEKRCPERKAGLPIFQFCSHEPSTWGTDEVDYAGTAQMSDGALEDIVSVDKSENITFIDERPVEHEETYIGKSSKTRDINGDIAESPWDLKQILERELRVGTFKWGVTSGIYSEVYSTTFPKCLTDMKSSMIYNTLRSLGFVRGGAQFRVQFNGHRFALGVLIVYWQPLMWSSDDDFPIKSAVNLPHVFLDASVSNNAIINVPFTHLMSHFPVRSDYLGNNEMASLGRLKIGCWNVLRPGEGAPSELTLSVYCKFTDVEVHQPVYPTNDMSFDSTTGVLATTAKATAQMSDSVWEKAAATGVGQALGSVLKLMTGGLATGAGNMLANLIFDRPTDPRRAEPILNRAVNPLCHGAGVDDSIRLSLCSTSQTESVSSMLSTNFDDFDLKRIIQVYQLLQTAEINTNMDQGTHCFTLPVGPTFIRDEDIDQDSTKGQKSKYRLTTLAYVSRGFMYWRGSMKIRIQFVMNQFQDLRVMFVFDPTRAQSSRTSITFEEAQNMNVVIADIQEQNIVEITLPYTSVLPWLYCNKLRNDSNVGSNTYLDKPGTSYMGSFSMFIVNKLMSPTNLSQTIDYNIYIAAGEDFELAVPVPLHPLTFAAEKDKGYMTSVHALAIQGDLKQAVIQQNPGTFANKHLIDFLYRTGRALYMQGRLEYVEPGKNAWWNVVPIKGNNDPDVMQFGWEVSALNHYDDNSAQKMYMRQFPSYSQKWRVPNQDWAPAYAARNIYKRDPELKLQVQSAPESYSATRQSGPKPHLITKGASTKEAAPTTISENAMNLQTVMRRYYPLYNSVPIYDVHQYTVFSIPVTPCVRARERSQISDMYCTPPLMNQICYFTKLFAYWRGSLRFKFVIQGSDRVVYAWFDPTITFDFRVTPGVPETFIQQNMAYAGLISVTRLQAGLEVEVPFHSRYNQLLVDTNDIVADLRAQNGTLFFAVQNTPKIDPDLCEPYTVTIFLSTGDDFVLNLFRGPSWVYSSHYLMNNVVDPFEQVNTVFKGVDFVKNFPTNNYELEFPGRAGITDSINKQRGAAPVRMAAPLKKTDLPTVQGLFGDIKDFKTNVCDTMRNFKQITSKVVDGDLCGQVTGLLEKANSLTTEDVIEKTTSLTSKAVSKYAVISAEILTAGSFIVALKESIQNPCLKNLILLAITAAGLIGFAFTNTLHDAISGIVNWVLNKPGLPQVQVLDGATAEFIDSHSTAICSTVAVVGTVFYAYLFGVLPSMITIKKFLKDFFEGEDEEQKKPQKKRPKAQALFNLKEAHFSVMGITALDRVYNKVTELISKFLDWILDRENPEVIAARTSAEYQEKILGIIKELDLLDNEEYFTTAKHDPFIHNRFYQVQSDILEMTKACVEQKLDSRVSALVTECRKRSTAILKDLERDSPKPLIRYDPICICLAGDSGTGKTKIMSKIARIIQEEMNLPEYNLVYPKGIKDEFWSGYKNQPIVFWDEFAQSRKADEVIPEFMTLRGSTPVMLNMAAVNDKGKYFTSQALVLTTNVPYTAFDTIRDQIAFKRRRHLVINMSHRPGYDAMRVQNAAHNAFPNWEHCRFDLKSSMTNRVISGDMNMEETLNLIRVRVRQWHENQIAVLQEADIPAELPRGVVVIPNQAAIEADLAQLVDIEAGELAQLDADMAMANERFHAQNENAENLPERVIEEDERSEGADSDIAVPDEYRGDGALVEPENAGEAHMLCEDIEEEDDFYDARPVPAVESQPWTKEELKALILKTKQTCLAVADNVSEEVRLRAASFCRTVRYLGLRARVAYTSLAIKARSVISEMLEYAMGVFRSIKATVVEFIDNNPRLAKLLGAMTLFTGVGTALYAFGNSQSKPFTSEGFYEHGPTKTARMKIVPEIYESGPVKPVRQRVLAEGCTDPVAFEIKNKVHPFVCPIGWVKTQKGYMGLLRCFRVCGSLILVPFHFFDNKEDGDEFCIRWRYQDLHFKFDKSKVVREGSKDWCLYDLGNRIDPAKNNVKYFISRDDLGKCKKLDGVLCSAYNDGQLVMTQGTVEVSARFIYDDPKNGRVYTQTGWKCNMPTAPGECGSILLAFNKAIMPPGKILGIHVAGYTDKPLGYSVLITREDLQQCVDRCRPQITEIPVVHYVDTALPLEEFKILPDGDFTIVGAMHRQKRVFQPSQTDLRRTPWADKITDIECCKRPAHLMPFFINGERISPLVKALAKYGHQNLPIDPRALAKVSSFLKDYLRNMCVVHTGKRVFSIPEAVMGIEGIPFAEKINFKSSPGWPYQIQNRNSPGKFDYFNEAGEIINEELKRNVDHRVRNGKVLKRVPSLWRDCLKDELRPNASVDAGKTRLFTIGPLDYTIVMRQYFMDFIIAFYNACQGPFISAVGMDPESIDWTFMYQYLAEHSQKAIAGDYSCFDGGFKPEVVEVICDAINAWYGDEIPNQNMRTVLMHEVVHTMQLVNDCVYLTHQGNPSGNPGTVIINTIGNLVYLLCAWLKLCPDKTCQDFFDYVHCKIYGDDVIATVQDGVPNFNQNTIAGVLKEWGIKFTPENKSEDAVDDYRELQDLTFLKRGFRWDEEVGKFFVLPTLAKETLHTYLFYFRKTEGTDEDQLRANMRAAINFAFFHGREFYNSYNERWKRMMRSCDMTPLSISFEEQMDSFLVKSSAAGALNKNYAQQMDRFMKVTNHRLTRTISGVCTSTLYYLCAALGIGQSAQESVEDDRWAVSIPSGEGKSTLCRDFPKIFVDHDDLLIPEYEKNPLNLKLLPWRAKNARKLDFPPEDRRILLVHAPANTKRRLIGSFITPTPTYIRTNIFQRLLQKQPFVMNFQERNIALLQIARELEPQLFDG